MDKKQVPDLFAKICVIYKCKHADFIEYKKKKHTPVRDHDNYIFIMKKYGDDIWTILDKTNVDLVKNISLMVLVAVWHLNHNAHIYHDDICAGRTPTSIINNIVLEKSNNENIAFCLGNDTKINIKTYGHKIRVIDFGSGCFKDIYIRDNIRVKKSTSINNFFTNDYYFKRFRYKSEVLLIIKCLLTYWKLTISRKANRILFDYYVKISKKYSLVEQFDEAIILDFKHNFIKIISMFSAKWPNPPYYSYAKKINRYQ